MGILLGSLIALTLFVSRLRIPENLESPDEEVCKFLFDSTRPRGIQINNVDDTVYFDAKFKTFAIKSVVLYS